VNLRINDPIRSLICLQDNPPAYNQTLEEWLDAHDLDVLTLICAKGTETTADLLGTLPQYLNRWQKKHGARIPEGACWQGELHQGTKGVSKWS
jgi:hypothetical protein